MNKNRKKRIVNITINGNRIQVDNIQKINMYLKNIKNYSENTNIKRKKYLLQKKKANRSLQELNKIVTINKQEMELISKIIDGSEVKHICFESEEEKYLLNLVLESTTIKLNLTTTRPGNNPLPPIENKF